MPKVTFLPSGVTIEVKPGTSVFNAAARAEIAIPSQCGGKCACALCRVKVVEGAELVSPMGWEEEGHMGNAFYLTHERLSCQLGVYGDVTIEIAEAPVKEKARGRYIPYSLVRKREKMEQQAELDRVRAEAKVPGGRGKRVRGRRPDDRPRGDQGASGAPGGPAASTGPPTSVGSGAGPGPGAGAGEGSSQKRRPRRGRGGRSRNPGAPRSGDSRAPAGAKKPAGSGES